MKLIRVFFASFIVLLGCDSTNNIPQEEYRSTIDDLENIPITVSQDTVYKNVYKILDGTWKGDFYIYEDTVLEDVSELPKEITIDQVKTADLKILDVIQVKQIYTSETPYFQRVQIEDFNPTKETTEKSVGVNKIQDGKMWCVVHKPTSTVIHEGSTIGKSTIIWQSNETNPVKKEYFKETVSEEYYEIIGYGYYGDDDTSLTPRLWFYSKYKRQ